MQKNKNQSLDQKNVHNGKWQLKLRNKNEINPMNA